MERSAFDVGTCVVPSAVMYAKSRTRREEISGSYDASA